MNNATLRPASSSFNPVVSAHASLVSSPQQIAHILSAIAQDRQRVSLLYFGTTVSLASRILAVDSARGQFLVKQPWNLMQEAGSDAEVRVNLAAVYQRTPIMLSSVLRKHADWDSQLCFAADIPPSLLSMELRGAVRVRPWPADAASVLLHLPQPLNGALPLRDLSESGFSIMIDDTQENRALANTTQDGVALTLTLPRRRTLTLRAHLRSWQADGRQLRLGFAIDAAVPEQDALLQRYVQRCTSAISKV